MAAVNWCELNALIEEWDLEGAQIQKIRGSYPGEVFLSCHRPGGKGTITLMLRCIGSLAQLLVVPKAPPSAGTLQRFPALLRARIAGSRIVKLEQLGRERILVFHLVGGKGAYKLIVRLWAQRANAFLEGEDGKVVDLLIRRRDYGEVPKMTFVHEVPEHYEDDGRRVRETGGLSLNEVLVREAFGLDDGTAAASGAASVQGAAQGAAGEGVRSQGTASRDATQGAADEQELDYERARAEVVVPPPQLKERKNKKKQGLPWRVFEYGGFTIWVGRHSKDNDALLRAAKSYDPWLHARDWAGSHVVIRTKPGKSVPLDTLLMAARLALYYSKGRSAGSGDVYYTRIKYLRRIKGAQAKVIPTQEENLYVTWDPKQHPLGKAALAADDAGSLE